MTRCGAWFLTVKITLMLKPAQSAITAAVAHSRKRRRFALRLSGARAAFAFLLIIFFCACAQAQIAGTSQTSPATGDAQDAATPFTQQEGLPLGPNGTSSIGDDVTSATGSGRSRSLNAPADSTILSATAIIDVLQQRPEAVVELKSLLADRLQQQGSQVQAGDITDEMLYSQIATSSDFRARITIFLQARGYVSADSLRALASGSDDANQDIASAQLSRQFAGSESFGRLGAGVSNGISALDSGVTNRLPTNGAGTLSTQRGNPIEAREKSREQEVTSSTDEPKVLRSPAPYNLQSLRDLYTQIPEQTKPLKRFGSEMFVTRDTTAMPRGVGEHAAPLDVPLGPDYILGPGDTLTINLWGGVTQSFSRTIDLDGRVLLPEAGSVELAGISLGRAQALIEAALKQQYRNAQISVTVSQLRSVRVYMVGDVQRPGGYDVSSLATPLSALYAAGGPTAAGSLRILRHYRGNTLVEETDLYDFLLHGIRAESVRFQAGDTLLVPPAGPQVAVAGAVKRPAIYELKSRETTLAAVVDDAGGFTVAASLDHVRIDRIDANLQRQTLTLGAAGETPQGERDAIAVFQVQDGDRIYVSPILPYSERVVYLDGHVVRPGRQPYRDGMRLSDVLHSYQDMLPEPAAHGEIVRLVPPDLHAETIAFDVPEVLIGNANVPLQPFDTVRIFGRYQVDAPKVTIHGEVQRPGTFPLSKGMTAAQLVRMAGGFKRSALLTDADLTSYTIVNGTKVAESLASVRIGAAVAGTDPNADVPLKPGDILTIHQITGWDEIGESVTIKGQVAFPGSYGFQNGERLSSVLLRAGGFRDTAYPAGAVLVREQVRELEQKSREELIRQIETSSAAARLSPNLASGDSSATLQLIQAQQDQVLAKLRSEPPNGRLVVHITSDIASWTGTDADIELRRGDVLTIPTRPGFVLVTGQVYNATALTFTPGKTAGWYLRHAGGASNTANRKEIFVIRANGSVIGRHSGGVFDPSVLATKLGPGDVVVVPQKVIGASLFWRNLLTAAQLASSVALTAAVASL